MASREPRRIMPGASVLGGAAGGLSYEGAVHDAMARDEHRDRPASTAAHSPDQGHADQGHTGQGHADQGHLGPAGHPAPQLQALPVTAGIGEPAYADQARHAGG